MRRSPLALLAAGLVAASAAGCGAATRIGAGGTLQIALSEYRVTPQDVRAAAGLLTIVVHNYGRLSHDLVISRGGVEEAAEADLAGPVRGASDDPPPRQLHDGLHLARRSGAGGVRNPRGQHALDEEEPGPGRRSYPHPGAGCATVAPKSTTRSSSYGGNQRCRRRGPPSGPTPVANRALPSTV